MSKCLTLGICLVTALLPLNGCGKSEITLRKEAAEAGDADSQFSLGVSYANGEGVRQDDAEAARWYRLAAEQGHADSMVMLGMAYETGTGIAQDNVEVTRGLMWPRLASRMLSCDEIVSVHYSVAVSWKWGSSARVSCLPSTAIRTSRCSR